MVFEDTEENARVFAGSRSIRAFPQLVDERSRMAVDYGVTGVPETYFIDARASFATRWSARSTPAR